MITELDDASDELLDESEDDDGGVETERPALAGEGIGVYLREIGRIPRVDVEQEAGLLSVIERGGPDADAAKTRLVEANLRLVVRISKRYNGRGLPLLDLIQEGSIGLMVAVGKFDASLGHKLSASAGWGIQSAILRAIYSQSRTIRLPVYVVDKLRKLWKAQRNLRQELGREPSAEEVA